MTGPRHDSTRRRRLRPWVGRALAFVLASVLVATMDYLLLRAHEGNRKAWESTMADCREYCARTYGIGREHSELPMWIVDGENLPDLRGER